MVVVFTLVLLYLVDQRGCRDDGNIAVSIISAIESVTSATIVSFTLFATNVSTAERIVSS